MTVDRETIWPGVSSGMICGALRRYIADEKITNLPVAFQDGSGTV